MIKALWFGRRSFADGLRLQDKFYNLISTSVKSNKHFICLFEHLPVYTVGLRDQSYTPEVEQRLRSLGADFQRIKRGGLITFHGPGQLVAYPILNLRDFSINGSSIGVKRYVSLLEEVLIDVATDNYGLINVGRTNDPGVWIDEKRKLAAIGIRVRNGITNHGIGLNCNTDLSWYNHIVPCGLEGKSITSLSKETGCEILIEDVLQPFVRAFTHVFQVEVSFQLQSENV